MHLNTSHVKVKQFEVELSGNWISDLNTSHVKVKPCNKFFTFFLYTLFKYISC